ncbi:hypothetical protein GCM10020331_077950 [Ectobacillus funiculus]
MDTRAVFVEGGCGRLRAFRTCFFTQYKVEAVMHFAASCLVGESMSNPLKYYEKQCYKFL